MENTTAANYYGRRGRPYIFKKDILLQKFLTQSVSSIRAFSVGSLLGSNLSEKLDFFLEIFLFKHLFVDPEPV